MEKGIGEKDWGEISDESPVSPERREGYTVRERTETREDGTWGKREGGVSREFRGQ